jgi:hypothetical protein
MDVQSAILVMGGRLAGPPSPDVPRDPVVRARLASAIVAATPSDLRTFLANLPLVDMERPTAKPFRQEGKRLKRMARKLRLQLRRLTTTTNSLVQ